MKSLFTSVVAILLFTSLGAQNNMPFQQSNSQTNTPLKSSSGSFTRLDSIVSPTMADYYYYNELNQHTTNILFVYDTTEKELEKLSKNEYVYNDRGLVSSSADYSWSKDSADWRGRFLSLFSYDQNGNDTLYISNQWVDTLWDFTPYQKFAKAFDANGNMISEESSEWDNSTEEWINSFKKTQVFSNNLLVEWQSFTWNVDSNKWINNSLNKYVYRSNQKVDSSYQFRWNSTEQGWDSTYRTNFFYTNDILDSALTDYKSTEWALSSKNIYNHNVDGYVTLNLSLRWNSTLWDTINKFTYLYNADNKLIDRGQYFYYNGWVGVVRHTYDFDEYDNKTLNGYQGWDYSGNQWTNHSKIEYVFDYDVSATDLVLPYGWDKEHFNKISKSFAYRGNGNDWNDADTSVYYYNFYDNTTSNHTLNVPETFHIYPNPTSNYLVLKSDKIENSAFLELINLQGKVILNKEVITENPIDIRHIKTGIYFYRIHSGDKIHTGKLLKK